MKYSDTTGFYYGLFFFPRRAIGSYIHGLDSFYLFRVKVVPQSACWPASPGPGLVQLLFFIIKLSHFSFPIAWLCHVVALLGICVCTPLSFNRYTLVGSEVILGRCPGRLHVRKLVKDMMQVPN